MGINDLTGLGQFSPLITELYKDMAQPAARNVGLALGAITSVGLFLHLLTSWGTDRLNLCLKNNLEQYAERIKEVPPEEVTEAPPEIAIPIIEKLSYVTNEELRELYIELLAKASIKSENDKAHPNFINIINGLSPDEALLLKYFKKNSKIVMEKFYISQMGKSDAFHFHLMNEQKNFIQLQFPNNLAGYLENFEGLGIINITESNTAQLQLFQKFEKALYKLMERSTLNGFNTSIVSGSNLDSHRQMLYVTNYGRLFLQAIISN